MKMAYPEFSFVIDTETNDRINTLVIENRDLFTKLIRDLYNQEKGMDGYAVLSKDEKIIDISKNLELHSQFVGFSVNRKQLITRLCNEMERIALGGEDYDETINLMNTIEQFFLRLTCRMDGEIVLKKLNPSSIIKAVSPEFEDEYESICEELLNYMELVECYEHAKIFVFVNLRSYVNDKEIGEFFDTVLRKGHHVLCIENKEYKRMENEYRIVIDKDLCEII